MMPTTSTNMLQYLGRTSAAGAGCACGSNYTPMVTCRDGSGGPTHNLCPCPCHGGLFLLPVGSMQKQEAYLSSMIAAMETYSNDLGRRRQREEWRVEVHAVRQAGGTARPSQPWDRADRAAAEAELRRLTVEVERLEWAWHFYTAWLAATRTCMADMAGTPGGALAGRGQWAEVEQIDLDRVLRMVDGDGYMPFWLA